MSEELSEFRDLEEALQRMPLRRPGHRLDQRIQRVLRPRWGMALGLAASLALLAGTGAMLVRQMRPERPHVREAQAIQVLEAGEIERPIIVAQSATRRAADDVIGADGQGTFRRVRRVVVEQVKYIHPETGKTIRVSIPREEIILIKVQAF